MTTYDYGGWLILTDGTDIYKVRCAKQPELGFEDPSTVHIDFPSDGHTGWTLDTRVRKVTVRGIWFTTTARYEAFIKFLDDAQSTGLKLQIQIASGGADWDWDGNDKTTMPVLWSKPRGIKKKFGGDSTIWEIGQIVFRQSAALEA